MRLPILPIFRMQYLSQFPVFRGDLNELVKSLLGNFFEALVDIRPLGELMGLYLLVTEHHTPTDSPSRVLLIAPDTSQYGLLICFSNL